MSLLQGYIHNMALCVGKRGSNAGFLSHVTESARESRNSSTSVPLLDADGMAENDKLLKIQRNRLPLPQSILKEVFSPIQIEGRPCDDRAPKHTCPSHAIVFSPASVNAGAARTAKDRMINYSREGEATPVHLANFGSKLLPSWLSHSNILMDVEGTPLRWCPSWQRGPLLLSSCICSAAGATSSTSGGEEVSRPGGPFGERWGDEESGHGRVHDPSTGKTEVVSDFSTLAPKHMTAGSNIEVVPGYMCSSGGWSRLSSSTDSASESRDDDCPCDYDFRNKRSSEAEDDEEVSTLASRSTGNQTLVFNPFATLTSQLY